MQPARSAAGGLALPQLASQLDHLEEIVAQRLPLTVVRILRDGRRHLRQLLPVRRELLLRRHDQIWPENSRTGQRSRAYVGGRRRPQTLEKVVAWRGWPMLLMRRQIRE